LQPHHSNDNLLITDIGFGSDVIYNIRDGFLMLRLASLSPCQFFIATVGRTAWRWLHMIGTTR
jgi:hypothetical protein